MSVSKKLCSCKCFAFFWFVAAFAPTSAADLHVYINTAAALFANTFPCAETSYRPPLFSCQALSTFPESDLAALMYETLGTHRVDCFPVRQAELQQLKKAPGALLCVVNNKTPVPGITLAGQSDYLYVSKCGGQLRIVIQADSKTKIQKALASLAKHARFSCSFLQNL